MDPAAHLEALRRQGDAFVAAVAAGTEPQVPSCPEWTVADLARHMGRIHRWAETVVRTRALERPRRRDLPQPPDKAEALPDWCADGLATLCATLQNTDPATVVWTFRGPGPAAFWYRRQAQETAMHRWDAENAHGSATPIDTELAADGIDELLEEILPMHPSVQQLATEGNGRTIHLHCADTPGEWLLRLGPQSLEVTREHAKGDTAVRAPASDILLLLWGRGTSRQLEVFGDATLLELWARAVRI